MTTTRPLLIQKLELILNQLSSSQEQLQVQEQNEPPLPQNHMASISLLYETIAPRNPSNKKEKNVDQIL